MTARDAYSEGYWIGYDIAMNCEVEKDDKGVWGCTCDEYSVCRECLTQAAYMAEENARQYSPFEFLANDLNEDEDRSDMLWDHYDRGVTAGIKAAVKKRFGRKRKMAIECLV